MQIFIDTPEQLLERLQMERDAVNKLVTGAEGMYYHGQVAGLNTAMYYLQCHITTIRAAELRAKGQPGACATRTQEG